MQLPASGGQQQKEQSSSKTRSLSGVDHREYQGRLLQPSTVSHDTTVVCSNHDNDNFSASPLGSSAGAGEGELEAKARRGQGTGDGAGSKGKRRDGVRDGVVSAGEKEAGRGEEGGGSREEYKADTEAVEAIAGNSGGGREEKCGQGGEANGLEQAAEGRRKRGEEKGERGGERVREATAAEGRQAEGREGGEQLRGEGKEGKGRDALILAGYEVEGVSVGGQETCVMLPGLRVAFDIGRCPPKAVNQHTLLITHSHMDHIGGVAFHIATRGLFSMKPPTLVVPNSIVPAVTDLINVFRRLDGSSLEHNLRGMQVGDEMRLNAHHIIKPFVTNHVIDSQGYLIYSTKQKLLPQFRGLPGDEIRKLKQQNVQITEEVRVPEVAFTGDTTPDFILHPLNAHVLQAKLLIMEVTFLDDNVSVQHARDFGHTHLKEVLQHADKFQNEAILFIHFSARYTKQEIVEAIERIPPPLKGRVHALLERF